MEDPLAGVLEMFCEFRAQGYSAYTFCQALRVEGGFPVCIRSEVYLYIQPFLGPFRPLAGLKLIAASASHRVSTQCGLARPTLRLLSN